MKNVQNVIRSWRYRENSKLGFAGCRIFDEKLQFFNGDGLSGLAIALNLEVEGLNESLPRRKNEEAPNFGVNLDSFVPDGLGVRLPRFVDLQRETKK